MSTKRRMGYSCAAAAVAIMAFVSLTVGAKAQEIRYPRGQRVVPVFEGWLQNADDSFDVIFGYMNLNYSEILDIPVGPDNSVEPGGPDQAQPTHFFPRRNRFTFRVRVPKDFGKKEVVWSLTSRGSTEKAFATLKPEYVLDNVLIMLNTGNFGMRPDDAANQAPTVRLDNDQPRTVKVGESLRLTAFVSDDGTPDPKRPILRGGSDGAPEKGGLRVGWSVYRGAGRVEFDPPHPRVDEPQQFIGTAPPYAMPIKGAPLNMLPDGRVNVSATFRDPGEYLLQFTAHDGGLATSKTVRVTVKE